MSQPFDFPKSYVEQWNLNIQRQLPGDLVLQAGYTGSEAHKLLRPVNVNQAFPGAGAVNSRRPYQGVSNINFYAPLMNSTYHALVAKLKRRFSKGLSLLASYTFGHSIDGQGNEHDTVWAIAAVATRVNDTNSSAIREFMTTSMHSV